MSPVGTRSRSAIMGDVNSSDEINFDISLQLSEFEPANDRELLLVNCVKSLLAEVNSLKTSVSDLSEKYDGIIFDNTALKNTVEELQKDSELITIMAAKAEQYSRRDTIIVSGVDMPANEQQNDLVKRSRLS